MYKNNKCGFDLRYLKRKRKDEKKNRRCMIEEKYVSLSDLKMDVELFSA